MLKTYRAYGLTLASEIELPDFATTDLAPVDVIIRFDQVAPVFEGATQSFGLWQAGVDRFQIEIAEAGRYLICDGQTIIIDRAPHASDVDIRAFLRSSAMAALLYQRGYLLIHASVVDGPEGMLFFFGQSGAGKSTIAAALERQGYTVLSDDIMAVMVTDQDVRVAPGPQSVWLWPDSGAALDIEQPDWSDVRSGTGKFCLQTNGTLKPANAIRAGFRLRPVNALTLDSRQLTSVEAFEHLWTLTFRRRYAFGMGLQPQIFRALSALVAQTPVFEVKRPSGTIQIDPLIACIEENLASLAPAQVRGA